MVMVAGMGNDFRRTHHETAMLDALGADQAISQ